MKDFFKNLFSADERKLSTVIVVLLALTGTGVYLAIKKTNDIPPNLTDCIIWLSAFLLGYNGLQAVRNSSTSIQGSLSSLFNKNESNQINSTSTESNTQNLQ